MQGIVYIWDGVYIKQTETVLIANSDFEDLPQMRRQTYSSVALAYRFSRRHQSSKGL